MQEIKVGIYAFISKVSGFCYVGQSINLAKRKREHLKDLRNGNHHAAHLQRHCKAHGLDCLDYRVLEYCDIESLTTREQFWMLAYEPTGSFNTIPAADSTKGFSPSAETRLKISLAGKGKKRSEETRALMRITNSRPVSKEAVVKMVATRKLNQAGKPKRKLSEKQKAALILSRIGATHTAEAKAKIGAASAARIFSEEAKQKMRASATGRKLTDAEKAKISAANKGRKRSPEMCARMSEQRKGIPLPLEVKEKISAAGKGRIKTPEHMAKIAATRLRNKLAKQA